MRKTAKDLLGEINIVITERSERDKEIHEAQPDGQTPEQLENDIESLQARLEMVHEGNPHVLREFEERGQKIEKTREKLERLDLTLSRVGEQIDETRQKWEPELDALVAQISAAFSENFSRINCAGQVDVYKDEDFENWAIQVQVKFR